MSVSAPTAAHPAHVSATELDRLLQVQRAAFKAEGFVTAAVRRDRVSRLALTILENIDAIAEALSSDYGYRPPALSKAFEATSWIVDVQETLTRLADWMAPDPVPGGYVQQQPKGVVGVVGAWNFPLILSFEPAMAALAAGNRVMLNYSELLPRSGQLLARLVAERFDESELTVVCGDLDTAKEFASLRLDHLFFTGSPGVGRLIAQAAAANLVPVTLELGGKNPVVVAANADLGLAAHRIAGTRALNSGQICLCPDFVFVPREMMDDFVGRLTAEFAALFPDYLSNPGVVSIVNDRNFDRVVGLVDDAVARGATRISVTSEAEASLLPDRATRRIPPTILLDVPDDARIAREEVFGPVLPVYPYDSLTEVITYLGARPAPLGAYWYGADDEEFRYFLEHTTSGGVTINDGIAHALLPGAPFGGVGNSGTGAYHGKHGFDTFTHRRTVATVTQDRGVADGLNGRALFDEQFQRMVGETVDAAAAQFRGYLKGDGS